MGPFETIHLNAAGMLDLTSSRSLSIFINYCEGTTRGIRRLVILLCCVFRCMFTYSFRSYIDVPN